MIRLKITSLVLAATLTAMADEPMVPDTVAVINNPLEVTVTGDDSQTTVNVIGIASDPTYRFSYSIKKDNGNESLPAISLPFTFKETPTSKSRHETTGFTGIYIGAVLPYNTPGCIRTSIEYGISELLGYRYTPARSSASFGIGFGFGLRRYLIRRATVVGREDDAFILGDAPVGATDVRSHLVVSNLQFPIYWRQRIHKSFGFKLTASLNLNVTAKGKSAWKEEGVKHTVKVKGLHQRIFTPEFTFAIGDFGAFSAYTRWSPVRLFKHRYGPDVQSVAIGMMIGL